MNWEIWIPLLIALAAWMPKILELISARKTKQEREGERKSLDAKTESEIVKAAESIAAGSTVTITNLLRDIEYQKQEVAEARMEINTIIEARRVRDIETQRERDELKARIQADLIETENLRKQVVKLEDLAIHTGEYVDRILSEAKANGWQLPMNGELMDSVRRLKLSIEERRRLAGK
jgi:membrane-associated HD superfamily phosphohydrolase